MINCTTKNHKHHDAAYLLPICHNLPTECSDAAYLLCICPESWPRLVALRADSARIAPAGPRRHCEVQMQVH
ncbi:hypothetical protein BRADI_1g44213v3 [Brachypodium distachyon]|uniref:Uncharacterized protein n=1 Tax=Brachypodium distachyon TaxID=15368 RepID=A0A0Q3K2Z7_BRADI|nr:hypothetical protein BRADI_1g44213v3 [Brachypodium distachyon]